MKKQPKAPKPESPEIQEWDLSQQHGIFPDDISLTQNIGCVGGKKKKESSSKPNKD
jgi:plastocyanin domain-containing protein